MKNKRYVVFCILAAGLIWAGCSKPKLYTGFEYKIDSIEDLFPAEFRGQRVDKYDDKRRLLEAEDYRRAVYGADASLEIWKMPSAAAAEEGFKKIVSEVNMSNLSDYSRSSSSGNKMFSYKANDGISGLIWTNRRWLFKAVGKNKEVLNEFLLKAELAQLK